MKTSILLTIGLITGSAFGKITPFTSADAMKHILSSKEVSLKLAKGQELAGLDFSKASVTLSGPHGTVGEIFTVAIQYANLVGGTMDICTFTATTTNEKSAKAPFGVHANNLSSVQLSKIDCVH